MPSQNEIERARKALQAIFDQNFEPKAKDCLRLYKGAVTTAPDQSTGKVGVTLVGDTTEISASCTQFLLTSKVGDIVWVAVPYNNLRNAVVWADSKLQTGGMPEITEQLVDYTNYPSGQYLWTYIGNKRLARSYLSSSYYSMPDELKNNPCVLNIQRITTQLSTSTVEGASATIEWQDTKGHHVLSCMNNKNSYTYGCIDHLTGVYTRIETLEGSTDEVIPQKYSGDASMNGLLDIDLSNLEFVFVLKDRTYSQTVTISYGSYTESSPIHIDVSFSYGTLMATVKSATKTLTTMTRWTTTAFAPSVSVGVRDTTATNSFSLIGTGKFDLWRDLA